LLVVGPDFPLAFGFVFDPLCKAVRADLSDREPVLFRKQNPVPGTMPFANASNRLRGGLEVKGQIA